MGDAPQPQRRGVPRASQRKENFRMGLPEHNEGYDCEQDAANSCAQEARHDAPAAGAFDVGVPFYSQLHAIGQPAGRPPNLAVHTHIPSVAMNSPLQHPALGVSPTAFNTGYLVGSLPAYAVLRAPGVQPGLHSMLSSTAGSYGSQFVAPMLAGYQQASMFSSPQLHLHHHPAFAGEPSAVYRAVWPSAQPYLPHLPVMQSGQAFPLQDGHLVPRPQPQFFHNELPQYEDRLPGYYDSNTTTTSSLGYGGQTFSISGSVATLPSSIDVHLQSSVPRGPPRKPRQSGHALWVGNLPVGARVTDLKDHFSKEATDDIESLKLISKSNCAFVNYRTEAACAAALNRFHDSRLHGMRLVCRLRRTTPSTTGTPAIDMESATSAASPLPTDFVDIPSTEEVLPTQSHQAPEGSKAIGIVQRFFVLKSLTLQDLDHSSRTGIWATQAHNEDVLNKAYKTADSVYLFFSANKSGEYFGYARMASSIPTLDLPQPCMPPSAPPSGQTPGVVPTSSSSEAGLQSIPTPATEWAPKGRIIDDSDRGTIFWEANPPASSSSTGTDATISAGKETEIDFADSDLSNATSAGAWRKPASPARGTESEPGAGKPFRVEWISTRKVPFFRTRGLRNGWNANREVKIARDGTELETTIGQKLLALFGHPSPMLTSTGTRLP